MQESSTPVQTSTNNPPKVITYIQNYVSPFNALFIFPVTISAILDILSPFGPLLLIAAILSALIFVVTYLRKRHSGKGGMPIKKTTLFFMMVTCLIFSASAIANWNTRHAGGMLANWVPKIKTWQDAYLVSIKEDTETIKQQNVETAKKVEKTNVMLAQMLDSMRPQLEKPLVEQIPGYKNMPENQRQALMIFTSKVGVNGIKRYHKLIKATNDYNTDPTPAKAKAVADRFNYIVRVNGKDVEDTKTKTLLMSLFLSPETYDYLIGVGEEPADKSLLKELNINTSLPVEQRVADPLGDLINSLQAQGQPVKQEVVIPDTEKMSQAVSNFIDKQIRHKAYTGSGRVSSGWY